MPYREERRLQCVAGEGVAIGGGRWRIMTVRGRNGAAVVRVGGQGCGVGWGEVGIPQKVSVRVGISVGGVVHVRGTGMLALGARAASRAAAREVVWGGSGEERTDNELITIGKSLASTAPHRRAGFPCGAEGPRLCACVRAPWVSVPEGGARVGGGPGGERRGAVAGHSLWQSALTVYSDIPFEDRKRDKTIGL